MSGNLFWPDLILTLHFFELWKRHYNIYFQNLIFFCPPKNWKNDPQKLFRSTTHFFCHNSLELPKWPKQTNWCSKIQLIDQLYIKLEYTYIYEIISVAILETKQHLRYGILTLKSFRSSFMDYFHLPLYQLYYQAHWGERKRLAGLIKPKSSWLYSQDFWYILLPPS